MSSSRGATKCATFEPGECTCGFHAALAEFLKSANLTDAEIEDFRATRLHQLTATIAKIQKEQVSKRRLRYMKRIDPFLKTMEQYGKVVDVLVNTEDIVAFIWVSSLSGLDLAAKLTP